MNNKKTIKNIVEHTINWMNNQSIYVEDYQDIKAGCLHKIVERRIKERAKYLWPNLNIYHPDDNSGLPDIYTDYYQKGIEIKCTFGWPTWSYHKDGTKIKTSEDNSVRWTNGTTQSSTEYFLFIKLKLVNNQLVAERIYFGKMSYNKWKIKPGDNSMYICESVVKNICKQIK
jgi:hypothetical protein